MILTLNKEKEHKWCFWMLADRFWNVVRWFPTFYKFIVLLTNLKISWLTMYNVYRPVWKDEHTKKNKRTWRLGVSRQSTCTERVLHSAQICSSLPCSSGKQNSCLTLKHSLLVNVYLCFREVNWQVIWWVENHWYVFALQRLKTCGTLWSNDPMCKLDQQIGSVRGAGWGKE